MDRAFVQDRLAGKAWSWTRGLARLWGLALVLVVWQLWVGAFNVSPLVMPSPEAVFGDLVHRPLFFVPYILFTLKHAGLGLALGFALGLSLAVISWYSGLFAGLVRAPAVIFQAIPIAAMTPVIARMFGYDEGSVIAVAVLISFFPTYVFVSSGLHSVSRSAADVFTVLRAGQFSRLWRLALPSAVPSMLLSIRVTAATAVLGALVAEWLVGVRGLGALLSISSFTYRVDTVWASAILGTALAVVAFVGASNLERVGREWWT